ncbi:hypothetical protein O181_075664 [Austropuccinia psidii MF-1]|uniref:Uncharacterized protein n=1 Tax=Austropuccinia psidii MF-1 TaxID=1389203 RepID=A0A9Q3FB03_9BASI|nr:hypothetical protein [Austropuccinia psidii MF-1]
MEVDSKVEMISKKGKETEKSPVKQNPHKEVPGRPIISKPELELNISNCNRYKSHLEGSDRNLHEPVQGVQGQRLGNVTTSPPRSDELLEYRGKVPQRGGKSEILQLM